MACRHSRNGSEKKNAKMGGCKLNKISQGIKKKPTKELQIEGATKAVMLLTLSGHVGDSQRRLRR